MFVVVSYLPNIVILFCRVVSWFWHFLGSSGEVYIARAQSEGSGHARTRKRGVRGLDTTLLHQFG